MTSLSNDPRFGEIIARFIDALPQRVSEMREQRGAERNASVRTLAHRLKGAAGSYGYPGISDLARRVETLCEANANDQEIAGAIEELAVEADRVACVAV